MFCLTLSVLSWDVLAALGRSVGHCPVRAGLSGLSLDTPRDGASLRLGCSVCAWLWDLMLSDLRWNVWSETVKSELGWSEASQAELECLV